MDKKVIVYGTQVCSYCIKLKDYLNENNIEFENIDISQDQDKANEMIEKTGQMGVPVIEIDGEMVIGFDKAKISSLLGLG